MRGSSQGSAYPGHSSSNTSWISQKHPVNCGDANSSLACRDSEIAAGHQRAAARSCALATPQRRRAALGAGRLHSRVSWAAEAVPGDPVARTEARKARREWTVAAGATTAPTPAWTSARGWIDTLMAWLATDAGTAECARLHIRSELVVMVASVLATYADHATGRHCAVSNRTVAKGVCSPRTVTTVRGLLSTAGLAIEVHRGTGSAMAPRHRRRVSVWHLISRPQPAHDSAVCALPPSRSDRRLALVLQDSPNARERASAKFSSPKRSPKRGRRFAPRPLHVQRLAAGVVAGCRGLGGGHVGRICDALTESGLDLDAWTAPQVLAALNADMRARGWSWPDHLDNPAGFLRERLRRLPKRPLEGNHGGGLTAARPDKRRGADSASTATSAREFDSLTAHWVGEVTTATTPEERTRLLRAHHLKFGRVVDPMSALAGAGRRAARLFPELPLAAALMRWAGELLGDDRSEGGLVTEIAPASSSLSDELLVNAAIGRCDCAVCGAPNAPERPQLPFKAMSMVCDQCWPVIAAELAQAGDTEEAIPA